MAILLCSKMAHERFFWLEPDQTTIRVCSSKLRALIKCKKEISGNNDHYHLCKTLSFCCFLLGMKAQQNTRLTFEHHGRSRNKPNKKVMKNETFEFHASDVVSCKSTILRCAAELLYVVVSITIDDLGLPSLG